MQKSKLFLLTEDLFGRSVDATLSLIAFLGALSMPSFESNQTLRASIRADKFLEHINYEVIKNALITASKSGFIKRRRNALPEITKAGRERLKTILPEYDARRVWDKRLHLITYDIPEKQRKARDILRLYLRRIGCAKLQESVWLTPYNPVDILRDFMKEHHVGGTVIVSDLGTDATIGEEDIHTLMVRLYHLEEINKRYEEWLENNNESIGYEGMVKYLAILKHDPQLPFAFLPTWWKGERAYRIIEPTLKKLSLHSRP